MFCITVGTQFLQPLKVYPHRSSLYVLLMARAWLQRQHGSTITIHNINFQEGRRDKVQWEMMYYIERSGGILLTDVGVSGGFKYLFIFLNKLFNNWMVILPNIETERKCWGHFGEVLWRQGVYVIIFIMFYRLSVQAILFYGSETCLITVMTLSNMEGYQL